MKTMTESDDKDNNENANAMHLPRPTIKQKEAIIKTYDLSNKAERLMYTNQTGKFPKKLSRGYQYIMVLIEIDRYAILVEAMKKRLAGEMIQAYQVLVERLRNAGLTPKMHIFRQRVLRQVQRMNQAQQHEVPNRTSTQPQAEYCRESDPSFQGTLHKYLVRRGQIIPTSFMGQTPRTSGTHTQHALDFKNDTASVSICIPLGQT
jgi:hypothetical protein